MKNNSNKTLVVLTGPTAVGKTDLSVSIAKELGVPIISADARQFYKELKIGVASPDKHILNAVKHYFIGHLSAKDYYNASMFENQALDVLSDVFKNSDYALVTGGSGLYIDALCSGIDELPDINEEIRNEVKKFYSDNGIEGLRLKLKSIDPEFYKIVDIANPNRMIRAIEVFIMTGQKFSSLRTHTKKKRNFDIKFVILNRNREDLYHRINTRVDIMVKEGLIEEMLDVKHLREFNALNTVGYKELFFWLDNRYTLKEALEKIKTNSRRYAKRQITWFKKYSEAKWIHPDNQNEILNYICS